MGFSKFFVCVILVTEIVTAGNTQFDYQKWLQHVRIVESFKCDKPQPRFISFRDLMNENHSIYRSSIPSGTILHKCRSAGCCSADKECKPINKNNVTLVFKVMKLGEQDVKTSLTLEAENHTLCGCQNH